MFYSELIRLPAGSTVPGGADLTSAPEGINGRGMAQRSAERARERNAQLLRLINTRGNAPVHKGSKKLVPYVHEYI